MLKYLLLVFCILSMFVGKKLFLWYGYMDYSVASTIGFYG